MHSAACVITSFLLAATALAAQQTIILPGQYSDLQSAINAASPGTTIEVNGSVPATPNGFGDVTIDKSITIAGRPEGALLSFQSPYPSSALGQGGQVRIGSSQGPIKVVFDGLNVRFNPDSSGFPGLASGLRTLPGAVNAGSELQILHCNITASSSVHTITEFTHLVRCDFERLTIRSSSIIGTSPPPDTPCSDTWGVDHGLGAVQFTGDWLVVEDSLLTAGNSRRFVFSPFCAPPYVFYMRPGTPALTSLAQVAAITRATLTNGSASILAPGPYPSSVGQFVAGLQAPPSSFSRPSGSSHVWQTTEYGGWSGHMASALPGFPAWTINHGEHANLRLLGSARIGESFTISVDNFLLGGFAALALSGGWQLGSTPYGPALIDQSTILHIALFSNTLGPSGYGVIFSGLVPVPTSSMLVGLEIVAQWVNLTTGQVGNASSVTVRG